MDKCEHKRMVLEFRDQFPRKGERFDPKSNGAWKVCLDCGYEEEDKFLSSVEQWGRAGIAKNI